VALAILFLSERRLRPGWGFLGHRHGWVRATSTEGAGENETRRSSREEDLSAPERHLFTPCEDATWRVGVPDKLVGARLLRGV
jgi:hypothetical protein